MRALPAIALVACTSSSDAPTVVECGAGTQLDGTTCVAPMITCGFGTHEESGECVSDPPATRFTLRVAPRINAERDGESGVDDESWDVVVFGRNVDGTPATDQIVLNTSRPSAGTFTPPTLTLNGGFSVATFRPCAAATPGCVGPVDITAALATAPATPVVKASTQIVAPDAIGTLEHCMTSGNVFYVEGKRFVQRGALTITDATFTRGGGDRRTEVKIVPTNPQQGTNWFVEFSVVPFGSGTLLAPGIYRAPATLQVFNDDPFKYCSFGFKGEFQIHEFVYTTSLQRLTATFREYCNDARNPDNVVTGCIHVE